MAFRGKSRTFAYLSQQRAKAAVESGRFEDEIVPVTFKDRKDQEIVVSKDEHPRPETTLEKLGNLKPLFANGTVTAGNASGVNDGAAALLLMSAKQAKELGLTPLARFVGSATAGVEPSVMGLGPINSTNKLLNRLGWTANDIDLIELNEAFASQSLECMKQLCLEKEKVNVNGGAIALGHPLGASGARILTTLLYEMRRRNARHGLVTMCIGVGQGISVAVENAY